MITPLGMTRLKILHCDDDPLSHLTIKKILGDDYQVTSILNSDEAMREIARTRFDVALLDVQMRTSHEGLDLIDKIRKTSPETDIVMSSGLTDFETVREAMRRGAIDYAAKGREPEELQHVMERVFERRHLRIRNEQQDFEAKSRQRKHVLVGQSDAILKLQKIIEKARKSDANVLITGETGTGKEVVAQLLRGTLSDGTLAPFVAIDSATITGSMAESILFGHEKGAFTGADRTTKGLFEEAHGGITYFDELANMPLEIQAKLLRVIQEKEVKRLGSTTSVTLDFRVVCATNRDLEKLISEGKFLDDLIQRLNVIPIFIPPLRERQEDIELLLNHFVQKNATPDRCLTFTPRAIETLRRYNWSGNVRELSNLIAYLYAMVDEPVIDVVDLPSKIRDVERPFIEATQTPSFHNRMNEAEKKILSEEYSQSEGNVSKMALALQVDRSHLFTRLKQHGIHQPKKREASL